MNQKKIFGHLKTIDSVSISRQGKKVTIPPFWATLKMYLPENVSMADFDRELYSLSPLITYCHPNYIAFSNDVPNDEFFNFQNSLYAFDHPNADINVDSAWNVETGEGFIKVAVFDKGIDTTHEDLNILGGYRYTDENSSFGTWDNDYKGHGTSVAGIIGAKRNNEIGIAGIAGGNGVDEEGVSLLGLKTLDDTGNGNASLVCLAIIDAARSVGTYYDWGADFIL